MSNDLLKLHLSAVSERASRVLSNGKNSKNQKGGLVEKSSTKSLSKTKRTKPEVNYLGMIYC